MCHTISHLCFQAMIYFLENHGPAKFSEIYLGEFDTPEAIWMSEMRRTMIQKIAVHLGDFKPRLMCNTRALYQVCFSGHVILFSLARDHF